MTTYTSSNPLLLKNQSFQVTKAFPSRAIFVFSDDYHQHQISRRIRLAMESSFPSMKVLGWARDGYVQLHHDDIWMKINKDFFVGKGNGFNLKTLANTIVFQIWLFNHLVRYKPDCIIAHQPQTSFVAWLYTRFISRKTSIHSLQSFEEALQQGFN